jgi:hypothetical protein
MAVDDPTEGALGVTSAFLDTFNACDAAGHAATLAYPHVRLASGTVRIWQDRDEAVPAMERGMAALRERAGWSHSTWDPVGSSTPGRTRCTSTSSSPATAPTAR